jgi:hypothetical protein
MKEKTIILIIISSIFLINSCQKISPNKNNSFRGKGSTLIEIEDSPSYYYELREINTKIDLKSGKEQCQNYGMIRQDSKEIYSYGLNTKLYLSNLLNIPEKDIFYQDEDISKYCFELNYKIKNNSELINKDIVINKVLNNYKLKLQTDSIVVQAYNLKIIDSIKLKNSLSKNKIGEYSYTSKNFETEFKGATLKHLADYLNKHNPSNHFFSDQTNINSVYDFKIIPRSNIKYLNEVLKKKYGLIFENDSLKIKRVIIKTAANTV